MYCSVCHRPLRSPESIKRGVGPCCAKKLSAISPLPPSLPSLRSSVDSTTLTILESLEQAGFEAYVVGGAVRDKFLGEPINDFDVCTNATPEQIEQILGKKMKSLDLVGKNYGVIIADGVEVATFRQEEYVIAGKPNVATASSFKEDSSRRDFTINGLAETLDGKLIDYHGGLADLQNKTIRAIGNPDKRFKEDYSRMLRAVYFASRFGFTIESRTFKAIQRNAHQLQHVPKELIGKIIGKVIKTNNLHLCLPQLRDTGLLPYVFPAIAHTVNQPQNPNYHHHDVFGHITEVVKSASTHGSRDIVQQLGAVFHDNAKALPHIRGINKEGHPNDLGHEQEGRKRAEQAVLELGYGKEVAQNVGFLVEHHGLSLTSNVKDKSIVKALRKLKEEAKDKAELRKKVTMLFDFMEHDTNGFKPSFGEKIRADKRLLRERFTQTLDQTIFYPHELPINGRDVAQHGFKGKQIGELLNRLVEQNIQSQEEAMKFLNKQASKR